MGSERGPLIFLDRSTKLTANRYINEIFIPHFLPFYLRMRIKYGIAVTMQEDNAPYHRNLERRKWKLAADLRQLKWPSQSPDLSPIENLWREVKLRIENFRHYFRTVTEFELAVIRAWESLTKEILLKYVATMPNRLYLVKKAKGGSIKY